MSYPEAGNETDFPYRGEQLLVQAPQRVHPERCEHAGFDPDAHFFDVGGGNGYVSHSLQENGDRTTLIEPGLQGCVNARKRGLSAWLVSSWRTLGWDKERFWRMGLFDVVEHIEDDVSFLRSAYEMLEVGGTVFITVPEFPVVQ